MKGVFGACVLASRAVLGAWPLRGRDIGKHIDAFGMRMPSGQPEGRTGASPHRSRGTARRGSQMHGHSVTGHDGLGH